MSLQRESEARANFQQPPGFVAARALVALTAGGGRCVVAAVIGGASEQQ